MRILNRLCVLVCGLSALLLCGQTVDSTPVPKKSSPNRAAGLPKGTTKIWVDRGELTPAKVYWGEATLHSNPLSRLPAPPYSHFEKDTQPSMPKAKLTDSKGVKWTIKLGAESRSDIVAPRLAWALGFGAVEGYYVESGRIEGVDSHTDLGRAKGW